VALKDRLKKLTATAAELDQDRLRDFCSAFPDVKPIAELQAREHGTVVGEIKSWRIVPRPDGSPWLEAVIIDGTGSLVAMWTGRKKIAGVHEGRRLMITGRGHPVGSGQRLRIMNPRYELL
jgi:hypothetical protein